MHSWVKRGLVGFLAAGLFVFFFVPVNTVNSGVSGSGYYNLVPETSGVLGVGQADIPPDCSTWRQLWPSFGVATHQTNYQDNVDNPDNEVSAGDLILLDNSIMQIIWAGPSYGMTCFPDVGDPLQVVWEPNCGPHDPASPVGEEWEQVARNPYRGTGFGDIFSIDQWDDNDVSNDLSVGDDVFSDGVRYHIDDIWLNIVVDPEPTAVEQTTWGLVKDWLRFRAKGAN